MKANKKAIMRKEAGVSAVIGVILMVAITIAISATVYAYVSGLISTSASPNVVPSVQFLRNGNDLIVSKTALNVNWSAITTTTGTKPAFVAGFPNLVDVGEMITGCTGKVTISMGGDLIGIYDFTS